MASAGAGACWCLAGQGERDGKKCFLKWHSLASQKPSGACFIISQWVSLFDLLLFKLLSVCHNLEPVSFCAQPFGVDSQFSTALQLSLRCDPHWFMGESSSRCRSPGWGAHHWVQNPHSSGGPLRLWNPSCLWFVALKVCRSLPDHVSAPPTCLNMALKKKV